MQDKNIDILISNLWHTLAMSGGVGLAASQINSNLSVFVIKSTLMFSEWNVEQRSKYFSGDEGIEEIFINPRIIGVSEETNTQTEGCLSIPDIYENIKRPWEIIIEYLDKDFVFHRKQFSGYTARVIQHEYDHLQGKLFIDHLSPLSKRLLQNKLKKISTKKITVDYPITY